MAQYKRTYPNGKITWCYDFTIDGERFKKCGYSQKKLAKEAEEHIRNAHKSGIVLNDNVLFRDYYRNYIIINKKGKISDKSLQTYINALNQFLTYFGEKKTVKSIKRNEYQEFLNWYGETHARESVKKVHNCIRSAIQNAVYDGYLMKDPTYNAIVTGSIPEQAEEVKFIEKDEFIKLKSYVSNQDALSYALIYTLIVSGARFSEINDLDHDDIKDNGINITKGKTKKSIRFISVPERDITHIRSKLNTNRPKPFEMAHKTVLNALERALEHCNIKKVTLHALRHSHCSYLLGEGINIHYVSRRLGHASLSVTLDTYAHLLAERYEKDNEETLKLIENI